MASLQMSLLDIAVKRSGEMPENDLSDKRTLIFVGGKNSGKSTLIQRFLEKSDGIKETLALEYSFGRRSGRSLNKDVCHVWELGGGTLFAHLLPTVLGANVKESTLIVVVDLSAPKTLWLTLETLLQAAYNHLQKNSDLMTSAQARVPQDHPDQNVLSPFPIPLIIIGSKYDVFVNMDPEEKKLITRTLRLVAHTLTASLIYFSDHDPLLVKKLKELLNHFGFGGAPWKGFSTDPNKPILIPFGTDTFEQMSTNISQQKRSGLALNVFKHAFTSHFPQETKSNVIPDDPANDVNFREPAIDQLRAHKNEELDRYIQELENKRRLSQI